MREAEPRVVLDGAYERALANRNLKVEYGVDDSDTALTTRIQVVHSVTMPLPKDFLASLT
jgi:hypothetical protein